MAAPVQPLDCEPVRPLREGRERELADMDRPVVLDQHDRSSRRAGLGTIELVELREMGHEVGAALARAGVDDELPPRPVCLPAIGRSRKTSQRSALFLARRKQRFAAHAANQC
jgi:hypothetical protein